MRRNLFNKLVSFGVLSSLVGAVPVNSHNTKDSGMCPNLSIMEAQKIIEDAVFSTASRKDIFLFPDIIKNTSGELRNEIIRKLSSKDLKKNRELLLDNFGSKVFEPLFYFADGETFGDFFNSLSNGKQQTKFLNKFGPSFHKKLQIVTRKDKFLFFKDYEKTKKFVIDESKKTKEYFVKCKDLYEKNLAEIERHNSRLPVTAAKISLLAALMSTISFYLGRASGYIAAISDAAKKLPNKTSKTARSNQNITYGKNEQGPNVENIGWQT